ncbi:MAG: hypothetical protein NW220_15050 [Leptolyngbyaceae cyanobacterium bins.349]|nr:hypothetical protein [Leptolyngbyaceae cyanobacterium bins.349]
MTQPVTQSAIMTQAKQGNPAAIAQLLNLSFQPRGITATTELDQGCLAIELQSAHPIPHTAAIAFIRQGLERLQPQGIQSVFVSARVADAAHLDWMETFLLSWAASAPPTSATKPDPPETTAPMSQSSPLPPSPRATRSQPAPARSPALKLTRATRGIAAKGVEALLIGLVLAGILFRIGLFKMLFRGSVVLVHEVGHAATHWAFGRPALPAVNILYGGGITFVLGQVWLLNLAIYIGIAYLIYRLRVLPKVQGVAVLFALVYTYWLFTPINQMLSVAMGHGLELVAIALCLFLAATGKLCRIPGDRAIYAMLGFFILFNDVEFGWQLLHDADFRSWYEGGIGGGLIDNDLVILANEYFGVELSRVATGFLLGCFLAPAIGVLAAFWFGKTGAGAIE